MGYEREPQKEIGSSFALTAAAADVQTLTPAFPVEIESFGVIITTAISDIAGTGFKMSCDLRPTAGSDTGRTIGGGSLGTLTLTNAQCLIAAKLGQAGNVIRSRPASASGAYPAASPGPVVDAPVVLPGQQAILRAVTPVQTAGNGLPFICYRQLPALDRAATIEVIVSA